MTTIQSGRWNTYTVKDSRDLFFYPQEWVKILPLLRSRQDVTLNMLLHTGGRFNEVRHITPQDIDFGRNTLILRITKVKKALAETRPKPRIIPVSSKFTKMLRKWVAEYKIGAQETFPMLSLTGTEECIKRLAGEVGRADCRDFSAHNIRKTTENWLLALNIDSIKVAKHLGHSLGVAMKHYISPDIFTHEDKLLIRDIFGDLYAYKEGRY